jgi:glycosyltransferase involved in cell wall biosynthesis
MKIAMVTDSFFPWVGGSETAIRMLTRIMRQNGHDVRVYGLFDVAESPDPNVPTVRVSSKWMGINAKIYGRYRNLIKELEVFKPDVINAHFFLQSGWAGVRAGQKLGIPTVVSTRGKGLFNRPVGLLEKMLFPIFRFRSLQADGHLATSSEMADMVASRWDVRPIPLANGVDTDHFRPGLDGASVRRTLGIEGKQMILCVRRLVPKNGIQYMVKALKLIRERLPNTELVLVAPREREYTNLKADAERLGIADHVHFVGEVKHDILPLYYAAADVVVQPSIAEARSLTCLESMASGSAIVATATGGLAELLADKKNGMLVEPFEASTYQVSETSQEGVERLAAVIIEVLENSELNKLIRVGARESSLQYDWKNITKKTLEIYESAIKTHVSGGTRYSLATFIGWNR